MVREHWFDVLNRNLTGSASRRYALRFAGALAIGLMFGESPAGAKKKKNKKGRRPAKGKPAPGSTPRPVTTPPARCGGEECNARFTSPEDIDACQIKCGQCRNREKFCVIGADTEHPVTHATCCFEHQGCCNGACVDLEQDNENCGSCATVCARDELCINRTCVPAAPRPTCPAGLTYCPAHGCIDAQTSWSHCGTCNNPCLPTGIGGRKQCVAGACVCADHGWVVDPICGCMPPDYICCGSWWCPGTHTCRPGGAGGCDAGQ